jgi:hypothetical protein
MYKYSLSHGTVSRGCLVDKFLSVRAEIRRVPWGEGWGHDRMSRSTYGASNSKLIHLKSQVIDTGFVLIVGVNTHTQSKPDPGIAQNQCPRIRSASIGAGTFRCCHVRIR